jgi:hypothetical protein
MPDVAGSGVGALAGGRLGKLVQLREVDHDRVGVAVMAQILAHAMFRNSDVPAMHQHVS